ncbi:MAG: sugar transferase [Lachnospiraceae bacterium]|nr:sugar transferase [Lachnospiraceae bacterium]
MYAPVIVFVYCRLEHTQKTLQALNVNELAAETDLYIFADNAKNENNREKVDAVRGYIDQFKQEAAFKSITIIKAEKNKGLANSIISGVTEVIRKHNKAIIVEDDLLTSSSFLTYMNGALDFYEKNPQIGSISAYTYDIDALKEYDKDIYMTYKGECWGWGTWKDRWEKVDWEVKSYQEFYKDRKKRKDFDKLEFGLVHMLDMQMAGKIDSWAVRWVYHLFENHLMTVYPTTSEVINFGFDGSGTHCKAVREVEGTLQNEKKKYHFENLEVDPVIAKQVGRYETRKPVDWLIRILSKILFRIGIKI